jgi:hypothetical protein
MNWTTDGHFQSWSSHDYRIPESLRFQDSRRALSGLWAAEYVCGMLSRVLQTLVRLLHEICSICGSSIPVVPLQVLPSTKPARTMRASNLMAGPVMAPLLMAGPGMAPPSSLMAQSPLSRTRCSPGCQGTAGCRLRPGLPAHLEPRAEGNLPNRRPLLSSAVQRTLRRTHRVARLVCASRRQVELSGLALFDDATMQRPQHRVPTTMAHDDNNVALHRRQ